MEIKELAKEYAEGKALDAMTTVIEQAYADGYNDGMQHREKLILDSIVDGVQYVDLQLPTGKMWSSTYLKDKDLYSLLPYCEASKLHIPTEEDFYELCNHCVKDYCLMRDLMGIRFRGINGSEIVIPFSNVDIINASFSSSFSFWLKDDEESTEKKHTFCTSNNGIVGHVKKIFMGYKLPVMLVKDK